MALIARSVGLGQVRGQARRSSRREHPGGGGPQPGRGREGLGELLRRCPTHRRPGDALVGHQRDGSGPACDRSAGEECYYGHRHTAAGGALEVDDTDGFGPEIFAQVRATPGTYRVGVAYYAAAEEPTPTTAIVQVFVRQGTSAERRYRYQAVLNREGDEVELGAFQVDPLSP